MPSPGSTTIRAAATLNAHPFHGPHDFMPKVEAELGLRLSRERRKSDLRGSWLNRRPCRRNGPVRPVVPGLQRCLDERRQSKCLRRSTRSTMAVAAKSPPGGAGIAAAHHLVHGVPAPAPLAPKHRQPEANAAQHHQFALPLFPREVGHVVLLCRESQSTSACTSL